MARKPGILFLTESEKKAWTAQRAACERNVQSHREALNSGRTVGIHGQHDVNREFELAQRAFHIAEHVLRTAHIVSPASDTAFVDIGTEVTYQRYDERGKEVGKPETVFVGGYGSTDMRAKPPIMAYDSLILISLLGCRAGASKTIRLANGKLNDVEVLDIRLPAAYPELRLVA
jgi:hypothetical protein